MSYPLRASYHRLRKSVLKSRDALWPSARFENIVSPLLQTERIEPDVAIQTPLPVQAVEGLADYMGQAQTCALFKTNSACTVDPKMGILFDNGRVVWGSTDVPERERSPHFFKHLTKAGKQLPSGILLHHLHGDNYFHFMVYVMSKVWLAEQASLAKEIPFIANTAIAGTRFFQKALELGVFQGRAVLVQPKKDVWQVGEAYLPRPVPIGAEALEWTAGVFRERQMLTDGQPVFALRSKSAANGRTFRNQDDVNNLLEAEGFLVVDPADLDLPKQAELFSQAPIIAGAHGAALTNMLFRAGRPTGVIELFSPGMGSPHYALMARELGFDYTSGITHSPMGRAFTATTEVDLEDLSRMIAEIRGRMQS